MDVVATAAAAAAATVDVDEDETSKSQIIRFHSQPPSSTVLFSFRWQWKHSRALVHTFASLSAAC